MAEKNMRLRVILDLADKALAPLKRISQGSSETAQTLKAARDQLKQLNNQQAALGNFEKHTQAMRESSNQLKVMRQNLQMLQTTGSGSAAQIQQHQVAIEKQTAKFKDQQATVLKLRTNLTNLGITNVSNAQQRMGADIAATTARIKAQTDALKTQADMQRRAAQIKSAQNANVAARGNARGALLDGVALAATLGAPIKMAMDWEQRLAELNKVAGKTPQELQGIADAAQRLAVETGVAREEIIGAYIAASQAGFAESEWAQFAEVSAKMGVAFDTTGDKAGEMLKAWRSGMNLSMDQAALLAGTVNHIANSMNATATDIGGVLQRQGAYLSAMGLSQTQSAALAATMLSGGATEEIAATASKNFMKAMTVGFAASKSQIKVFDLLKLDPEKLAKQMQQAPEKAIVDVMQRLQKLAPDQLAPAMKMLFGDESIGPAAQIVKSVDGLVDAFAMADDKAKTLGSLQAEFDSMGNTTQQQMKKASEGVKVVTTALGMGLLPTINNTLAAFAPMALGMAEWMQANEGAVTTVVSIIAAIMAFKVAVIAGAYAFTFLKGAWLAGRAVLFTLRTAWMLHTGALVAGTAASRTAMVVSKALTAAQWLFNAAMSANPIGLLIIAILGLVTAGYMLWSNWKNIAAGGKQLWQDLVEAVRGVLDGGVAVWIKTLLNFSPFGVLWNAITAALGLLGVQVPEQFKNFGSAIVDGLIGGLLGKLAKLKDTVIGVASSAANWFKEKLGIASPSKVFTQFGGWISEGAAKGIEAGQAGVRAASVAMAAAALAPATAATGAAGSTGPAPTVAAAPVIMAKAPAPAAAPAGGNTYTITIQAAPGADPNAIARAVAAELDKRESAASARSRGAMYDNH